MAGYIGSKSSVTQVDGYSEAEADAEFVNDPNSVITVDGSNVGIGTSSPERALHVNSGTGNNVAVFQSTDADARVEIRDSGSSQGYNTISVTSNEMYFGTNNAERMRIDSSGNVGIGVSSSIGEALHVKGTGRFENSNATPVSVHVNSGNTDYGQIFASTSSAWKNLVLNQYGGNVLVGKTASSLSTNGSELQSNGTSLFTRSVNSGDGAGVAYFQRNTSDGNIIMLYNSSTSHVGSIGTSSGVTYYAHSNGDGFALSNNYIYPSRYGGARDNQIDIGISWARWDNIYATNGTIQTSDFNEKQDIASLTATEMLVGKRISALFKTFRWKDSVAEKGDNARTHTGVIAQDVQAAFTAEGLDAGDYALFISSTWWEHDVDVPAVEAVAEVTDEDGNVTTEAVEAKDAYTRTDNYDTEDEAPEGATSKTRLGIRYPALLSFVAAYNEQRFASIEARLTALEDV